MNDMKSVLLVEDDIDDQMAFTQCIDKIQNASVFAVASNGQEALDKLENAIALPDIIFMDINMPCMNGLECLSALLKNPRTKHISIVMLSTDTTQESLTQIIGAKAFIKKPDDWQTLQVKIEQMVNMDFETDSQSSHQSFH